jgi:hypothetical protein
MKRAVIIGTAIIAMLAFPLNAIASPADKKHKGYHKHKQHWQHHREQRRADVRHRFVHKTKHAKHIVNTDYRAVKHRVKHQRIAQQRHRNWINNHGYHHRLSNSRDVYIHYYGPARHYDRHHRHYRKYHIGHHRYHKRHDHDNDYLEWLGIMYLLNDIYDEDY